MTRAGFRLLRIQAFRPRERERAELHLAEYRSSGPGRRLRDQIKKEMRIA
jgi:hypothetical protein